MKKGKLICHCTCFTRHHQQLGEKNKAANEQAHRSKDDDDEVVTSCLHLISLDCYTLLEACMPIMHSVIVVQNKY